MKKITDRNLRLVYRYLDEARSDTDSANNAGADGGIAICGESNTNGNDGNCPPLAEATVMATLRANPFFENERLPIRIEARLSDRGVGSILTFPAQLVADNVTYPCNAGSSLYVDPACRGYGIGTLLAAERLNAARTKISLAAGLSHMSRPLFEKSGCHVFLTQRLVLLKNARPFVAKYLRPRIVAAAAGGIVNAALQLQRLFMKAYIHCFLHDLHIMRVEQALPEIERIIARTSPRFREDHPTAWFDWHLHHSFAASPQNGQLLYVVKRDSEVIGFFMTKTRLRREFTHKKFKNVVLGSVIEWGAMSGLSERDVCLLAIASFGKADLIELCTDHIPTVRMLRRFLMHKAGDGNFAVYAGEGSPLREHPGYDRQSNWRIRPASSDNGLS